MPTHEEEQVTEAFLRFGRMFAKGSIIVEGFIVDVDEEKFTCTVNVPRSVNGKTVNNNFFNVPLKILRGSQASILEVPAVSSVCLLTFRDNNSQRPQLYMVDKCDKILVKIGDKTLQIVDDEPSFIFNGGNQGYTVLLSSLVTKLNNIEKDINNLKAAFRNWVVTPYDGGAKLKAAAATWMAVDMIKTQESDIENKQIKQ
jgi:hypothetical protein